MFASAPLPFPSAHGAPASSAAGAVKECGGWSPYVDNGGTCVGIAGRGFAVVAADTRMSDGGLGVASRAQTKMCQLTPTVVLASCGMRADCQHLHRMLQMRVKQYEYDHGTFPSVDACATLLSNTLYGRRFFPIFAFNSLVGLRADGTGVVYDYDAIGSMEALSYGAAGSGMHGAMTIMDTEFKKEHLARHRATGGDLKEREPVKESMEKCREIAMDVLASAGERDIFTGDSAEVLVITPNGVEVTRMQLQED